MKIDRVLLILLLSLAWAVPVAAHELSPAYLELKETAPNSYQVLWKVPSRGEGIRMRLTPLFPEGVKVVSTPTSTFFGGSHVQKWAIQAEEALPGRSIAVEGLSGTMTDALVRIEHTDGITQVVRLTPDAPSFVVEAAPNSLQVASTYLILGIEHILLGIDHLLFILALLMLVSGWGRLIGTITAFTISHSITLVACTLGFITLPGPPVEAVIALSIVFLAREMLVVAEGKPSLTAQRPWIVAFVFGLLHGFGFAGVLSELGLPQNDVPLALLMFNVGVEVGQLLFVAGMLIIGVIVKKLFDTRQRWAYQLPAYAIGGVASFWLIERVSGF